MISWFIWQYTVWSKKSTLFCFSSQSCVLQFFSIFFRWCRQQASEIWHQYGSNWTLYYAAGDKNHWGILYCKISSSDTAAMQERFWQEQCTWWKDNSTFGGQIWEGRKCGRCLQRLASFIVQHNSWEYSEFTGMPWRIPQKINMPSLTRNWHFENISFEDPPWWL